MQNNRKKKKVVLMILIPLLLVMAAGACVIALNGFSLFTGPAESRAADTKHLDENGSAVDGTIQSKAQEQILKELQDQQINVTDKLGSHIYFPSGKAGTEGNWIVENVETNTVTIQCEVYMGDKMIAKSVPIKPNQHIESIILSEDVAPGEYTVIAYVNYYDISSGSYLAKAGFKVSLTVQ